MDENQSAEVRRKLSQLAEVLPSHGRVLLIPHDYPDPDALASAAALHLLLARHYHLQSQIVFSGMVSRAENRELLRHCRYKWRLMQQVREPRRRVPALFVDTTPWSGNVTVPPFVRPVGVIDHHATAAGRRWGSVFADIRPHVGAGASILFEYLAAAGVSVPRWLAGIMAYAIATETLDLSLNCTPLDLEAYTTLLGRANMTIVGRMRHAPLPRWYFVQLQEALRNVFIYGRVAWTHLDRVQQPEIVAEVADLLCRMERVTWSFCTAYHEENLVVSLRSSQSGARCGRVLKSAVKDQGSAGGHQRMAAGYLDMKGLDAAQRESRREDFVRRLLGRIERRPLQQEPLEMVARPLVEAPQDQGQKKTE